MKIVQQDIEKLHKTAGDSVEKLLSSSNNKASPSDSGSAEQAEDSEELQRYQAALSYLSESARLPETAQSSENAVTKLPKIPFAEKIRAEYQEKVAKDLEFLVPECPKLKILVIGRVGAGKSTLCGKLLGLSDHTVS
jgi:ABC-type transport system involved in cytochrome bd biosynthesis fused ATPase/permease subunit